MVRVLAVFNFLAQQTKVINDEDIVDSCLIDSNSPTNSTKIILAKKSGLIEIYDSNKLDEPLIAFPAIEDVLSISHSIHGNYLACLEENSSKSNRRNVRVYCNFDQQGSESSGIRARIAGKVTPVYSTSAENCCLEMLEIPIHEELVNYITCCGVTGNLFALTRNVIHCFTFMFRENEKLGNKYVDFFETPFIVELDFIPEKIKVAENIFVAMNGCFVNVFQIVGNGGQAYSSSNEASTSASDNINHNNHKPQRINLERDIDFNEIKNKIEVNDQTFIVDISSKNHQQFHQNSKQDVDLSEMKPIVITTLQTNLVFSDEKASSSFDIQSLLQLKFAPAESKSNLLNGFFALRFLSLNLEPIYYKDNKKIQNVKVTPKGIFESKHYDTFIGCSLLVSTQQDGFLYIVYGDKHNNNPKCIAFPYTSPLIDAVLDSTSLHALTENGIETYTIRTGHKLFANVNPNKTICLVGLRPFLGIKRILLSASHLVLLASSNSPDVGGWTAYCLKLPSPDLIYQDFEELAKKKYSKNRNAFIDLIEEAHIILRTNLEVSRVALSNNEAILKKNDAKEVQDMFKDSCILLGDLYSLSAEVTDYSQSLTYYQMANLTLMDIFKRMKKLQNGEMKCIPSLIFTLKTYLTHIANDTDLDALLSTPVKYDEYIPVESLDVGLDVNQSARAVRFGEIILEILLKYARNEVASVILQLPYFMNYFSSQMFNTMKDATDRSADDNVCLILYLTKRNAYDEAKELLKGMKSEDLLCTLKKHFNILFDVSIGPKGTRVVNFSDFTEVFFLNSSQQKLLIDVCLYVLSEESQFIDYDSMLRLFMDHLATLVGDKSYTTGQNLVQDFLEKYFHQNNVKRNLMNFKSGEDFTSLDIFSSNSEPTSLNSESLSLDTDNSMRKSVRILIRLYLSHLKYASNNITTELRYTEKPEVEELAERISKFLVRYKDKQFTKWHGKILFYEKRNYYLDLMVPLEPNLLHSDVSVRLDHEAHINLLKLQSILCNQEVSSDIYKDIALFVQTNPEILGSEAILTCIYPTNVAVEYLMEKCPQAVLQYGIDKFKNEADWVALIKNLQKKINASDEAKKVPELMVYYTILRETLQYIAIVNPLELTMKLLCDENFILRNIENCENIPNFKYMSDFSEFIHLCNDTKHSSKLRQMIVQTGHQLFEAINKNKIT